jgi:hypothetical protein
LSSLPILKLPAGTKTISGAKSGFHSGADGFCFSETFLQAAKTNTIAKTTRDIPAVGIPVNDINNRALLMSFSFYWLFKIHETRQENIQKLKYFRFYFIAK